MEEEQNALQEYTCICTYSCMYIHKNIRTVYSRYSVKKESSDVKYLNAVEPVGTTAGSPEAQMSCCQYQPEGQKSLQRTLVEVKMKLL